MARPPAIAPKRDFGLVGRQALIEELINQVGAGRRLIGLEGITGVGKSAVLETLASELQGIGYAGVARLNAAELASEELAIGAIYTQLRSVAPDPEAVIQQLKKKFAESAVQVLRTLTAAVIADVLRGAAENAEKTIEAVQGLVEGGEGSSSVAKALGDADNSNQRYFLTSFLAALEAAGNPVVIAVDHFDGADPSLSDFLRYLIRAKPGRVALLIAHNVEDGNNQRWNEIVADLEARGGKNQELETFPAGVVREWFHKVVGRLPTEAEVQALLQSTGGRAFNLKTALEAIRDGGTDPIHGNFSGYYANKRAALSAEARTTAELLSVINYDAAVPADLLAGAALQLGVSDVGPALIELHRERLLRERDGNLGLAHRLAQDVWRAGLTGPRTSELGAAWFSVVRKYEPPQLTASGVIGLIDAIVQPLIAAKKPDEIAEIGRRLIASGQVHPGLMLLDHAWHYDVEGSGNSENMLQHALLAARTRLDLGRYSEVDEPLTMASRQASTADDKRQVALLQMKLALRRNAYQALWAFAKELEALATDDPGAMASGQQILNVAYRDLMDYGGINQTTAYLLAARGKLTPEAQMSLDRNLARALAKLGRHQEAAEFAEAAFEASQKIGSVRDVGNAHLARAEAARYRHDFDVAISSYKIAEELARATGNRDSQIWALLGEAAAYIEARKTEEANQPLEHVSALLVEPGYHHPLETAHAALLKLFAGVDKAEAEPVLSAYRTLGIDWPSDYVTNFLQSGSVPVTTPL
ncbi:ATP-binding protein [Phenylobacterium sp.]|uniref:ATP-binding protein n=1 Tax=Phenylobacterium sp. TaxID=1871053 RepID=UPI0027313ACD|nr:ATP-binding protein [Phenylobacterium sp.]MDP1617237.1 ATP-binding protein [Phenylobacterium sp.]